ncbi:hypothetical protein EXP36_00320 [Salmonella enterica subsp. enterica serovar Weltevreden]|uniref:Uncharacterized protein n=1 Tax=Salmonella phage SPN3US TaxID=1090134 RepID=G5DEB8_9CAUD|nr:hypothetical protein [[Curtobacterium] plantarum]YP_009153319.1 hypothetical protein ACQ60_gp241 [Salmonella phage SPN3US]EAB7368908.1 hypothetical protein [Salmonella enterica subsp. enterica serovar Virchow]EBR8177481.1 hypothetical protein [Salmonella enterica subsp. enterica serovar Heidelberg]EBX2234745.1 hypothetical protein [Salmonella enterica subsp. enterica serovar Weltevreden]EBY0658985.1 hypothetical protein [Salmonella enterica subsp. enterica serovar Newport]EBY3092093.1 hypo
MIAVGTLSTRGWARTPQEKARELMNHYTESGYSQSVVYRGNIKSLAYTQAVFAQDPDGMVAQIKMDLENLYGNVFPAGVEVETSWEFLKDSDVRYRIFISVRVQEVADGEWYDVERYVDTESSAIEDM